MQQPERPSPRRLSIELDPSTSQIGGVVVTEREERSFYGWMQLTALLNEINQGVRGAHNGNGD